MAPEDTDEVLVLAARGGDRWASAMLLARHYPLALALCRRMLDDAALAEDAAQEASLQALLNLDRLRQPERFGPWLAGIGLNICRRWLRHRSREVWSWDVLVGGQFLPEPPDEQPGPEALSEAADLGARVRHAVAALPPGQQAAVLLVYLDNLSHAEAAATLGVAVSAIKTRLFKARRTLRQRLSDLWQEEPMIATEDNAVWVEFRVKDVRRHQGLKGHPTIRNSVILEEVGGAGRRSVWGIGPFEAEALAVQLAGVQLPRPLPYLLMARLLEATGGQLREVRLAKILQRVGYGELVVTGPAGERTIDARLSDALNLALVTGAPIHVASSFLWDAEAEEDAASRRQSDAQLYGEGTEGPVEIAAVVTQRLVGAVPLSDSPS